MARPCLHFLVLDFAVLAELSSTAAGGSGRALFERSEFRPTPTAASSARNRAAALTAARLLFAYFLLAKQEKVSRPPGRDRASHAQSGALPDQHHPQSLRTFSPRSHACAVRSPSGAARFSAGARPWPGPSRSAPWPRSGAQVPPPPTNAKEKLCPSAFPLKEHDPNPLNVSFKLRVLEFCKQRQVNGVGQQ